MYATTRYWSDVKNAWTLVDKAGRAFGKSLLKSRDPFVYVWPCLLMVAQLVGFFLLLLIFTGRRLINK